jgi:hypothetical protein
LTLVSDCPELVEIGLMWSGFMSDETKAIEETAKAAQALAKTSSKAIDATRHVGGWLDRMFGRAIEHTVGRFWTDRASRHL